jgi:uncharacterized protein
MDKTDPSIREKALLLIQSQSTMHLATAKDNQSWVAPVYYVLYKSSFFFFSSPDSRHIVEGTENGLSSASISTMALRWQDIKGIQMSGHIRSAGMGFSTINAFGAYISKFPFTKEFFTSEQPMDLETFVKQFRVKFYRFDPTLILYVDNHIRFGFRAEISI